MQVASTDGSAACVRVTLFKTECCIVYHSKHALKNVTLHSLSSLVATQAVRNVLNQ